MTRIRGILAAGLVAVVCHHAAGCGGDAGSKNSKLGQDAGSHEMDANGDDNNGSNDNAGQNEEDAGTTSTSTNGGNTNGGNNGGNNGLPPYSGGPVALEDYPEVLAGTLCPRLTECCQGIGVPLTTTGCQNVLIALSAESLAGANPDNYVYDPEAAGGCIANTQQAVQESCGTMNADGDLLCSRAFAGRLDPGVPCTSSIECAGEVGDDRECRELETGEGDVCVLERRASVTDACYWTCRTEPGGLQICSGAGSERPAIQGQCFTNDGVYCSSDRTCHTQGVLGADCENQNSCAVGYCNNTTDQCTAPVGENQACTTDAGCLDGLYCKNQLCIPELEPNSPCDFTDECRNGDCEDGVCVEDENTDPSLIGLAFLCAVLSGNFPLN